MREPCVVSTAAEVWSSVDTRGSRLTILRAAACTYLGHGAIATAYSIVGVRSIGAELRDLLTQARRSQCCWKKRDKRVREFGNVGIRRGEAKLGWGDIGGNLGT